MFLMEQKMFTNKICSKIEQKMFVNENRVQSENINALQCFIVFLSLFTAMSGLLRNCIVLFGLFMVLFDLFWACIAFYGFYYGLVGHFMAFYGLLWPFYGPPWPFMANYLFDWTYVVFSRGHRSKLIWSCFFLYLTFQYYQNGLLLSRKAQYWHF